MLARYINKSDEPEAARMVGKRDGIARGRRTNKYSSTTRKRTDYRPGSGLLCLSGGKHIRIQSKQGEWGQSQPIEYVPTTTINSR